MNVPSPPGGTSNPPVAAVPVVADSDPAPPVSKAKRRLTSRKASLAAVLIAVVWTTPTLGLLISSFRPPEDLRTSGWWTFFANPAVTLENYNDVLFGGSTGLINYFVNSLVITIPVVIFTTVLAALAAYAFAWMKFRGRDWIFVLVFALQIIPLQMSLIPLLQVFTSETFDPVTEVAPFLTVWIAHTAFGLPLAIFLLHNFISEIPRELVEAAKVDGAGHGTIFWKIMLPLLVPALASFAIFEFLWVWNDLLVALVFAGGTPDVAPLTVRLADLAGSRGNDWQRLTAGAFVSIVVPLLVFLGLQRYFVRGLLAGSVKG